MKVLPTLDRDFWTSLIKLVSVLAGLALAVLGASTGVEGVANANLEKVEANQKVDAAYDSYGEYTTEVLTKQARCDQELEAFVRHHVGHTLEDLRALVLACHSDNPINVAFPDQPAEDPHQ